MSRSPRRSCTTSLPQHSARRLRLTLDVDTLVRDCRHAVRNLLRTPGFAIVTIVTLALGIGANTAIFSVVNAVILRPLGYPQSDRLSTSRVSSPRWDSTSSGSRRPSSSSSGSGRIPSRASARSPRATRTSPLPIGRAGRSAAVSADLFQTLGVHPFLGRTFDASETRPGGAKVAVLSYEIWQSAFGADASLVGKAVDINGARQTIVGIMPPKFDVADNRIEVWLPLVLDPANRQNRGSHFLYLIGRLADGRDAAERAARSSTRCSRDGSRRPPASPTLRRRSACTRRTRRAARASGGTARLRERQRPGASVLRSRRRSRGDARSAPEAPRSRSRAPCPARSSRTSRGESGPSCGRRGLRSARRTPPTRAR